jgi:glycerol-1-phosphate dehydrogenase [NAD(P)+]
MVEGLDEHYFSLPRNLVVGNGIIDKVGVYFSKLWPPETSVLIITGPHVYTKVYPRVKESLEDSGFNVDYMIVDKPTVEIADKAVTEILAGRYDIIAGLGGGKSIDVAKYASFKTSKNL